MIIKRPLLAQLIEDRGKLRFPLLASIKLDGIRGVTGGDIIFSRKLLPIPNKHIQQVLAHLPPDIDGELIVGNNFHECSSAIMSEEGIPDFTYWVFDYVKDNPNKPFYQRYLDLLTVLPRPLGPIKVVKQHLIRNLLELERLEKKYIEEQGEEGLILRDPAGIYKFGRSTFREHVLLKDKPFEDSEAIIIGFVEYQHNTNPKEQDNLGYTKRSTKKAGKVPAGILGKFLVKDLTSNREFELGTGVGLTKELRELVWNNKERYLGKIVKYKYQAKGSKNAPRLPIWLGFRDERDL